VPNSPIFVTLMMDALLSSEKSVLTTASQVNIPEDGFMISLTLKSIHNMTRLHIREDLEIHPTALEGLNIAGLDWLGQRAPLENIRNFNHAV
jgi:hypothetical protein